MNEESYLLAQRIVALQWAAIQRSHPPVTEEELVEIMVNELEAASPPKAHDEKRLDELIYTTSANPGGITPSVNATEMLEILRKRDEVLAESLLSSSQIVDGWHMQHRWHQAKLDRIIRFIEEKYDR